LGTITDLGAEGYQLNKNAESTRLEPPSYGTSNVRLPVAHINTQTHPSNPCEFRHYVCI